MYCFPPRLFQLCSLVFRYKIFNIVHTVSVYDRIRQHTVIYGRIRLSYISVYGAEMFAFYSLRIFLRSPYTKSVSHRITPYTRIVYGSRVRPPYISVFLRKRSFTTVHVRPGYLKSNSKLVIIRVRRHVWLQFM